MLYMWRCFLGRKMTVARSRAGSRPWLDNTLSPILGAESFYAWWGALLSLSFPLWYWSTILFTSMFTISNKRPRDFLGCGKCIHIENLGPIIHCGCLILQISILCVRFPGWHICWPSFRLLLLPLNLEGGSSSNLPRIFDPNVAIYDAAILLKFESNGYLPWNQLL